MYQYDTLNLDGLSFSIILEKPEDAHRFGGRISAFSGVSSSMNWLYLQETIRGNNTKLRRHYLDLEAVYTGQDPRENRTLLDRHDISHVIVTSYERESYPKMFPFERHYPVAVSLGSAKVYQVREVEAVKGQ